MSVSTDGTAYVTGTDNLGNPWKKTDLSGINGLPQAVPISNYTAVIARNSHGALCYLLTPPKEAGITPWSEIPHSSGITGWAAFYLPDPARITTGSLCVIGPDAAGSGLAWVSEPVNT